MKGEHSSVQMNGGVSKEGYKDAPMREGRTKVALRGKNEEHDLLKAEKPEE